MRLNKECETLMKHFAKNLFNPISGERLKAKILPARKTAISTLLKKKMISTNVLQSEYWLSLSGAEWARQYCAENGYNNTLPDETGSLDNFKVGDKVKIFDNFSKEYFTGVVVFSEITDLVFMLQIKTKDDEIESFPKNKRFTGELI